MREGHYYCLIYHCLIMVCGRQTCCACDHGVRLSDVLCDCARLDDWMREVPSGSNPKAFTVRDPPAREPAVDAKYAAHAGILSGAKHVIQDCQVGLL